MRASCATGNGKNPEVEMPWLPDFIAAAELVRQETRAAGHADPVTQYLHALTEGDTRDLETVWPVEVAVFDPYAGEVRGHRPLRHFAHQSRDWLANHLDRTEIVASTTAAGRAVVEVLAHLTLDGEAVLWPLAVVAESSDERSVVFRTYCSQWPVTRDRPPREPILAADATQRVGDVVGRYRAALDAGDTDAIVSTFERDGYLREPIGPHLLHRGPAELRAYFAARFGESGGVGLELCCVTDDGVRCALEYNCVRWGTRPLAPQAGIAVFERAPDGLLAAIRVYDDVVAPTA